MRIAPYIFFNGQAKEAIAFYETALGATLEYSMPMGDGPPGMSVPAERKDWIMHATLRIGESVIMMSDDFAANSPAMAGSSVQLTLAKAKDAKAAFDALAAGGEIRMPWEATFWTAGFGTLTDKFGVRWMVGCDEEPTKG